MSQASGPPPADRPEPGQAAALTSVPRRLRWGAVLSVAALVLVAFVGSTWAAFVDIESGDFEVGVTIPPRPKLTPQGSSLAGTALAIDDQGRAVIWGQRGYNISGTGVETVTATTPASVVALPAGRTIEILTGGSNEGTYAGNSTFVVALDNQGQIWTWGFSASEYFLGGRQPTTEYPLSKPGPVNLPDRVVDVKTTTQSTIVLTAGGDVYTWGKNVYAMTGQGSSINSATPRRILTGVHSIGAGYWAGWAVAAPGWTKVTYASEADAVGSQSAKQTSGGLLFWGRQDTTFGGGSAGDGRVGGNYHSPGLVASSSPLAVALAAGTAAGDDNVTLGVRAGSKRDGGTFQQMTGSFAGNQFRLRDGSTYLWGNSPRFATGSNVSMTTGLSDYIPQLVKVGRPIVQISTSVDIIFLRDDSGTVWMYGSRANSGQYPNASGVPQDRAAGDIRVPTRIDGGTAYPGWAAQGVIDIVGSGINTFLRRSDGSFWIVCGASVSAPTKNGAAVVRNYLDSRNSISVDYVRPLTQLNL
ncbi:MAG: hypothetical protein LBJ44_11950 [Propionibacteriaceae bacterium]|jgi:hypothetical protein|nr:hypothetical protein [Propionibacteriaceae bacterium]